MKKLLKFISSKMFVVPVLILLQLLMIIIPMQLLDEYNQIVNSIIRFVALLLILHIWVKPDNPTYRFTWIILITATPIFGVLIYFLFGERKVPKELLVRDEKLQKSMDRYMNDESYLMETLAKEDLDAYKQSHYLSNSSGFPVYTNTKTKYFTVGETQYEEMLTQLKNAKSYIFMEFFIIKKGYMWNTIVKILEQKVKEGVDVRLIYDDYGCMSDFTKDYVSKLKAKGIKIKAFNPIRPRLSIQMNNRDHRKILVVDGKVAMTGGINIADEYINMEERFGHWKDCGCLIEGEAVWSFTFMFLQFWNYDEKEEDRDAYEKYHDDCVKEGLDDGYVQPFADTPTDDEKVGEYVHINMINVAKKYVYITTPYLVIDQEMKTALMLATKNGVDVRILVPHIPDKWYVFKVTQHYYTELILSGVKVYEYTPGFVHAKTFVCDDTYAVVGTTNMDYRSYYLHYECGVLFYKSSLIKTMKEDYLETLKISQEITMEDCQKVNVFERILRALLNLFSPLF